MGGTHSTSEVDEDDEDEDDEDEDGQQNTRGRIHCVDCKLLGLLNN